MPHVFVLDTGVLFSTWANQKQDGNLVTVPSVLDEIRNRPSRARIEMMHTSGRLTYETPESSALDIVREAAKETGDDKVLSHVDLELLALAQSKMSQGQSTTLVSTDLAVLNTARHMGLSILDPSHRFQHEIIWSLKCPACNYNTKAKAKTLECPVCGTAMRRVVSKKKKTCQ